jgi:hypothetical protein
MKFRLFFYRILSEKQDGILEIELFLKMLKMYKTLFITQSTILTTKELFFT